MKVESKYVVVRQASNMGGHESSEPNYYVGRLKVFEDGDVDDVILLAHTGCKTGARTFTCTLVETANKESMSEKAIMLACDEFITSQYKAQPKASTAKRQYPRMSEQLEAEATQPTSAAHSDAATGPTDVAGDVNAAIREEGGGA